MGEEPGQEPAERQGGALDQEARQELLPIAGEGKRDPPEEQSSGPHRARVRCSTELAGWPDRADDRHRAGQSQNRTAELCLQHPSAGDAGTDGSRIREWGARRVPKRAAGLTKHRLLTTNYEPKS